MSPRRLISIATVAPSGSRARLSTGPIAVGYSRRTRVCPGPSRSICSASSACRCASTPSLTSPGSTPSSWLESCRTSCSSISRRSSVLVCWTCHTAVAPRSAASWDGSSSLSVHGGLIQLSGLYEPPSECRSTEPSALTSTSRVASGRLASRRPEYRAEHRATTSRTRPPPRSPHAIGVRGCRLEPRDESRARGPAQREVELLLAVLAPQEHLPRSVRVLRTVHHDELRAVPRLLGPRREARRAPPVEPTHAVL